MPESQPCLDARASLEEIRSLRLDFGSAYAGAASYGNPEGAERAAVLKRDIETRVAALRESVFAVEAERLFGLRRQYESQVSLLRRAGLVEASKETDGSGAERETFFMTGIDGKRYPLPSYETVAQRMFERRDLLAAKADQGFTKLILVPFGMPLSELLLKFHDYLATLQVFSGGLRVSKPVDWQSRYKDADVLCELLYDQVSFGPDSHGNTKYEILHRQNEDGDTAAGWRVLLLQTGDGGRGIRGIRTKGTGTSVGTKNPRRDIDSGLTVSEYISDQLISSAREDSPYFGESGMCPEEWIVLFLAHFEETGRPLDDYKFEFRNAKVLLTGAYFTRTKSVAGALWVREEGYAYLGQRNLDDRKEGIQFGPRYAVRA